MGVGRRRIELRKSFPKFARYLMFKFFFKHVKIKDRDECWIWQASTNINGYGYFRWPAKHINYAHIASYELFIGSTNGLRVCHSCDNPPCVNPYHLWLGTDKENQEDCTNKGRGREGEKHGRAKLTWKSIDKIKKLYSEGKYTQVQLAKMYGVTKTHLSDVICGRRNLWNTKWRSK
jgi:hypothetical protein